MLVIAEVGTPPLRCWVCPACVDRQMAHAIVAQTKDGQQRVYHVPLPSQCTLYELGAQGGNVLWGGRAMAAKSVGGRWWLYYRSLMVPGHEALLLRENWAQLQDNHTSKMANEVPALGGRWFAGDPPRAVFGKGSDEAVITCGHMADAASVLRYRGGNKGAIVADEGVLYPVDFEGMSVLAELRTIARQEYQDRQGRLVKPVFAVLTNPGGPSNPWLNDFFVTKAPDYDRYPRMEPVFDAQGVQISGYDPSHWHYIPATLDDNPYAPPGYREENLAGLSEVRYRQLAEGDFSAFIGAFFPEFHTAVHLVEGCFV